mgnify:CR=1 FL=1
MKRPRNSVKKELVNVRFQNVMSTDAVVQYVLKKIKRPKFTHVNLKDADINIKKETDRGADKFSVSLSITVHNVKMYFVEVGQNLYQLIDALVAKINRKLAKMRTNRNFRKQKALKFDY